MTRALLAAAIVLLTFGAASGLPASPLFATKDSSLHPRTDPQDAWPDPWHRDRQGGKEPGSNNDYDISPIHEVNTAWCLALVAGLSLGSSLLRHFQKSRRLVSGKHAGGTEPSSISSQSRRISIPNAIQKEALNKTCDTISKKH